MKRTKITAILLSLVLMFSLTASALAEETYGARQLTQERQYTFHDMLRIALEEVELRLAWLQGAAERFPQDSIFTQALAAEVERAQTMRLLFAGWGLTQEPADPPHAPEIPQDPEQALQVMRTMEERAMLMFRRLQGEGKPPQDAMAWANQWEHTYQQQMETCQQLAQKRDYAWAWHDGNGEQIREQNTYQGEGGQNQQGPSYQGQGDQDQQGSDKSKGSDQDNGNGKKGK